MLINQQITDNLKENIWQLDWENHCEDKAKYNSDTNYREQVKNDWFTKLEVEIEDYKNKVINQFTSNGFIANLADNFYSHYSANIIKFGYKLKYSKNEKTNPFEADIRFYVNYGPGVGIYYNWYIENPVRIYYKRYLNWGERNNCNPMLFTNRGFKKTGGTRYQWGKSIDEWVNGPIANEICKKLKKTITDMESKHEKLQKDVQQKVKELHIQEDDVSCMLSELNSEFKDINVKFLFNGECNFDYTDSPIRFNIVCSNNPMQDDENLYVKEGVQIDFADIPFPSGTDEERMAWQEQIESRRMKLFTNFINTQAGYYRSYTSITLIYRPNEANHWHYEINYPISVKTVENTLEVATNGDCGTIDEIKANISKIFNRDASLYKVISEWKNALK
jgi:hypothetical protein